MSAKDFAVFLREEMGRQRLNNTEVVRRANISRRTWYRLLDEDTKEAKTSTLMKLAKGLNIDFAVLNQIYFKE